MALTNSGFDGTVNEAQYANMWALGGVDGVSSSGAWAVTQGTGRQVSVAAQSGYAFARGVLSISSAAITANLGTPTNGQWYLIVRRIDWATNTVSVVAIPHTTTTTTVPTVAPGTFPTFNDNPGVLYDHKLSWAWVTSVNTTVTLFDLRTLGLETRMTGFAKTADHQINSYLWANAAARNALTGMVAGATGYQSDTALEYTYNGTAWRVSTPGLVPIIPTAAVPSSGTATIVGNKVSVNQAPLSLRIDGVFSTDFTNYRVLLEIDSLTTTNNFTLQFSAGGTPDGASVYDTARNFNNGTTASSAVTTAQANAPLSAVGGTRISSIIELVLIAGQRKLLTGQTAATLAAGTPVLAGFGGQSRSTSVVDGLNIQLASAVATAGAKVEISVFGYNNG